MSKKTLRLLFVVMTLVCIVALLFAFSACNKTDGGDNNNNGDNNTDLFDRIELEITPTVKQVSFYSTRGGQYEVITDNTYYYAPAMQQTLEHGNFQFVIDLNYELSVFAPDRKTTKRTIEINLSTDPIDQNDLWSGFRYNLTKNIGTAVSFTLSDLYSDSVAGKLHSDLLELGISEEDANTFTGRIVDGPEEMMKYSIPLCFYVNGYDAKSEKVDLVDILLVPLSIMAVSFTLDFMKLYMSSNEEISAFVADISSYACFNDSTVTSSSID